MFFRHPCLLVEVFAQHALRSGLELLERKPHLLDLRVLVGFIARDCLLGELLQLVGGASDQLIVLSPLDAVHLFLQSLQSA